LSHATDKHLLNRLRRANGHLTTIIGMIEANRDGMEIAQQMQAVIGALENAKGVLIRDHIEHHLEEIVGPLPAETREKLAKLSDLAKFL
jgi:DNA-binding FrmR family transcriptional regulator